MRGLLVLSVALGSPPDQWFGEDKLKHFVLSALVQSVSYSALQLSGVDGDPALAGATAVTLGLGVGKEWCDRRAGGAFSGKDLTWDVAGAATATLWLRETR
ncbi:MAG TPA: hypothetical protein VFY16_00805 [Gemmatimonadaceae bacterium]|nr:hypothetical protein [Gemmatimonadaceae bacterium]